jgi:small subunit ribosomal protein S4
MGENIWPPVVNKAFGHQASTVSVKSKVADGSCNCAPSKSRLVDGDVTEKQFRSTYKDATRSADTGQNLIGLLERRLT